MPMITHKCEQSEYYVKTLSNYLARLNRRGIDEGLKSQSTSSVKDLATKYRIAPKERTRNNFGTLTCLIVPDGMISDRCVESLCASCDHSI
jgi:hypothetical protein